MKTRCKVGDLAYLIYSEAPESIGAVVEILRPMPLRRGLPNWRVRSLKPLRTIRGRYLMEGNVLDQNLRPITGLPIDEETREELTA